MTTYQISPELDLVLQGIVDMPRELVWAAWAQPEQLKQWFYLPPWKTVEYNNAY